MLAEEMAKRLADQYELLFNSVTGKDVLDDLKQQFYYRSSYVKGDPNATTFNEGLRAVIIYIMNQMGYSKQQVTITSDTEGEDI